MPDAEAAAKHVPPDYHMRGHMDIERLDDVLCQDIKVGAPMLHTATPRCVILRHACIHVLHESDINPSCYLASKGKKMFGQTCHAASRVER